jgi:hypothetical protein
MTATKLKLGHKNASFERNHNCNSIFKIFDISNVFIVFCSVGKTYTCQQCAKSDMFPTQTLPVFRNTVTC